MASAVLLQVRVRNVSFRFVFVSMLLAFILWASSPTAIFVRLLRNHLFSTFGFVQTAEYPCKEHMSQKHGSI